MGALIALFVRSIRQTTRSGGTYLLRAGLAGGVLVAMISAHMASLILGAPGLLFFQIIFFLNYFYLGLAGCGFFATAITEEKEEGTLGLLRMTNLNALSILLGKSTSRLCAVLLLIAVQVPFLMLGVTMGGVSVQRILSAYALLGLFAFSAANFALLCSVYFRRVWSASVITLVVIVGAGVALPMFSQLLLTVAASKSWFVLERYEQITRFGQWLGNVSPFGHLRQITTGSFWQSHLVENAITHLSFGAIFFLTAWWLFDRRCQGEGDDPALATAGSTRRFYITTRRRCRPWPRAIAWKDFHFQYGGWPLVMSRIAIYLIGAALVIFGWSKMGKITRIGVSQGVILTGNWILSVELAIFAALLWSREHWGHTLGSIVALPRSLGSVFLEKLIGLLGAVLPSLALIIIGISIGGSEWVRHIVSSLFSDEISAPTFIGLPGFGVWGLLRILVETVWYLHLVAYLSLRLRWTALPAAYGIAGAVSIAGQISFFSVMMMVQGPSGLGGSGVGLSNPLVAQSLMMSVLYGAATVLLFRLTRNLILVRAGES
jgi:ABC-type transport system involved in multi-copper enzyme maturation permease subunit